MAAAVAYDDGLRRKRRDAIEEGKKRSHLQRHGSWDSVSFAALSKVESDDDDDGKNGTATHATRALNGSRLISLMASATRGGKSRTTNKGTPSRSENTGEGSSSAPQSNDLSGRRRRGHVRSKSAGRLIVDDDPTTPTAMMQNNTKDAAASGRIFRRKGGKAESIFGRRSSGGAGSGMAGGSGATGIGDAGGDATDRNGKGRILGNSWRREFKRSLTEGDDGRRQSERLRRERNGQEGVNLDSGEEDKEDHTQESDQIPILEFQRRRSDDYEEPEIMSPRPSITAPPDVRPPIRQASVTEEWEAVVDQNGVRLCSQTPTTGPIHAFLSKSEDFDDDEYVDAADGRDGLKEPTPKVFPPQSLASSPGRVHGSSVFQPHDLPLAQQARSARRRQKATIPSSPKGRPKRSSQSPPREREDAAAGSTVKQSPVNFRPSSFKLHMKNGGEFDMQRILGVDTSPANNDDDDEGGEDDDAGMILTDDDADQLEDDDDDDDEDENDVDEEEEKPMDDQDPNAAYASDDGDHPSYISALMKEEATKIQKPEPSSPNSDGRMSPRREWSVSRLGRVGANFRQRSARRLRSAKRAARRRRREGAAPEPLRSAGRKIDKTSLTPFGSEDGFEAARASAEAAASETPATQNMDSTAVTPPTQSIFVASDDDELREEPKETANEKAKDSPDEPEFFMQDAKSLSVEVIGKAVAAVMCGYIEDSDRAGADVSVHDLHPGKLAEEVAEACDTGDAEKSNAEKSNVETASKPLLDSSEHSLDGRPFRVQELNWKRKPRDGQPEGFIPVSFQSQDMMNLSPTRKRLSIGGSKVSWTGDLLSTYMDRNMLRNGELNQSLAEQFYREHFVLLQAILQLLAERDRVGVEASADSPDTIKKGPLKKSGTRGAVWRVKYVEIRKGLFTYYDDVNKYGKLMRRNLPLRASLCTCRAVSMRNTAIAMGVNVLGSSVGVIGSSVGMIAGGTTGSGYAFELTVAGGPKRLFMANSKEERQSWIRAIHFAMIGVSSALAPLSLVPEDPDHRKGFLPDQSSYKGNFNKFQAVQSRAKKALTKEAYMQAFADFGDTPLTIPVQWIKEYVEGMTSTLHDLNDVGGDAAEGDEQQLLEDLARDDICINGFVLSGQSNYGPERIVGAVCRCILEFDRSSNKKAAASPAVDATEEEDDNQHLSGADQISEVQAISYARDVILACNQTHGLDDSRNVIDSLCNNPDLVLLVNSSSPRDPVQIEVSCVMDQMMEPGYTNRNDTEKSGWILTRVKSHKPWRKRFFVLSDGILSYYEHASPRPHGLRGKLALPGSRITYPDILENIDIGRASFCSQVSSGDEGEKEGDECLRNGDIGTSGRYVLYITPADRNPRKQLRFEDYNEFVEWRDVLRLGSGAMAPDWQAIPMRGEGKEGIQLFDSADFDVSGQELADVGDVAFANGSTGRLRDGRTIIDGVKLVKNATKDILRGFNKTIPIKAVGSAAKSNFQELVMAKLRTGGEDGDDVVEEGVVENTNGRQWRRPSLQMLHRTFDSPRREHEPSNETSKLPDATVRIDVQSSSMFEVVDHGRNKNKGEKWATIRTRLVQTFLLSGGPNGRIVKGEELLEVDFARERGRSMELRHSRSLG